MKNNVNKDSKQLELSDSTDVQNTKRTQRKPKVRGNRRSKPRIPDRIPSTRSDNDVAWYKTYPELFQQATNISTMHVVGSEWKELQGRFSLDKDFNDVAATILFLDATAGGFLDSTSAINRAGENLYNIYRGKYTSTVPFESSDIMCFVVAYGNVLALASHIRKLLNTVNIYYADNQIIPEYLFRALNLNWQHERSDYAINKYRFDSTLIKARFLTLPKFMPYFEKCTYMFKDIFYQDKCGSRGDFITASPRSLYKFAELDTTEGLVASGLDRVLIDASSISELIDILDELLDALVNNESVKQISGWLHQNSGVANVISAFELATTYYDTVKVSSELPYQLKNAKLNEIIADDVLEECVIQDENGRLTSTKFQRVYDIPFGQHAVPDVEDMLVPAVFQYSDHTPTNDDIMINTRLTLAHSVIETATDERVIYTIRTYCDTWVCGAINVTMRDFSSLVPSVRNYSFKPILTISDEETSNYAELENFRMMCNLNQYSDWLPEFKICFVDNTGKSKNGRYDSIMSRDYNYTVSQSNLIRLHEVALLSEFFNPANN